MSKNATVEVEIKGQKSGELDDEGSGAVGPIFEAPAIDLAYILIRRLEPLVEQGTLGKMDGSVTELDLKERFGGGKYLLEGRDGINRIVKNCRRTIEIAGDPKFQSRAAEARWLREQGISPVAAPAPFAAGPSFGEIIALMAAQNEQARQQMQVENERRDREQRERDDRHTRERAEAEDRRRTDDREREDRRQREQDAERQRDRDHQKAILELLGSKRDEGTGAVTMLLEGMKVAREMMIGTGGGDGDDKDDDEGGASAIANAIAEGARAIPEAIRAARGEASAAGEASAPSSSAASEKDIVLKGPIAEEMTAFVQAQKAKGKDPERILSTALRTLTNPPTPNKKVPVLAAVPPAAPEVPATKPAS